MREIDPRETKRAAAFELWMKAPMPMITLVKTFDVTKARRISKRRGCKFNMLLCWCIGRAAARTEDFYHLPVGDKLMQFELLGINTVVALKNGGINTCDVPFCDDLVEFEQDYLRLTERVKQSGQAHELDDRYMIIGTSALARHEIDAAMNIYAGVYNNPFLIWGKYRKGLFRTKLPVSFQFHHTQMDGEEAAEFLEHLQEELNSLCFETVKKTYAANERQ